MTDLRCGHNYRLRRDQPAVRRLRRLFLQPPARNRAATLGRVHGSRSAHADQLCSLGCPSGLLHTWCSFLVLQL